MPGERVVEGGFDARASVREAVVAHGVSGEGALWVAAGVHFALGDRLGQDHGVRGHDRAARRADLIGEPPGVGGMVVQVTRYHHLQVGEVHHESSQKYAHHGRYGGEPPGKGHPAQDPAVPREAHYLCGSPRAGVPGAQQQTQKHEVREHRRAAVAHKGQRDAGERDETGHASHDHERLQSQRGNESRSRERRHVGACAGRGGESPHTEQQVHDDQCRPAEQPGLLCSCGDDGVGLHERYTRGEPLADPHAGDLPG